MAHIVANSHGCMHVIHVSFCTRPN